MNMIAAHKTGPSPRIFFHAAIFLAAIFVFVGCATTDSALPALASRQSAFADKAALSSFVKSNLPEFSSFMLSNGIPVVIKSGGNNRVQHISLVIRGGAAALRRESAGLESLALRTMARASSGLPYEKLRLILDETSSAIGVTADLDYSSFNLTTLDKYLPRLLPLWMDCLAKPAFTAKDYEQVFSDTKLALQAKMQDPWAVTGLVANRVFFDGHPYAASPDGTLESLTSLTFEAMKDWYAKAFSANRMFIVAVGGFDPTSLKTSLEAGLSSIPDRGFTLPPEPASFTTRTDRLPVLTKQEFPASRGIAYVRGDFAAPSYDSDDYFAAGLAAKIFADLLFDIVRDEHGAAYSPNSYIRGFSANYGSVVIFKTKVAGMVKSYIDEAAAELAAGRAVSIDPESSTGSRPRMSFAQVLPAYKAMFINELYGGAQTNAAVATRITRAVIDTGDCRSWLLDPARIDAVSAQAVLDAAKTYILGGGYAWAAVGSQDTLLPMAQADYEGFRVNK